MATQTERKNQTRDKLIDAFFELNNEKPIDKISISQITTRAGCHRSTFYEYFSDIYDLREQEEESILKLQMDNLILPIKEGKLNLLDTQSFLYPLSTIFEKKQLPLTALVGQYGDPSFQQRMKENIKTSLFDVLPLLKNDVKKEYLFEFFTSGLIAVINKVHEKNDISINELIQFMHPLMSKIVNTVMSKPFDIGKQWEKQ